MNIHFFNSFKYPDSEQSFCNHDEGSHYSTPHFIYWSSSADITTCRAYIFDEVLIVVALGGETTPLLQWVRRICEWFNSMVTSLRVLLRRYLVNSTGL